MITRRHTHASRGFTLVELLVSMVIALVVMAGIASLVANTKHTNQIQRVHQQMVQNGRFALEMIASDLRRAGYWSGNIELGLVGGTLGKSAVANTCSTVNTTWGRMLDQPLFGLDDTNAGYDCIPDASYVRGDILVIRYASEEPATAMSANRLYFRSSITQGRIFPGSAASSSFNLVSETPLSTRALVARAYYLGPSARQCPTGTAVPALMMQMLGDDGRPTATEQITGVDHIAFQYGIDSDQDGSVESYVNADQVANWSAVSTVRLWLLLRAECPDAKFLDDNTYVMGDQSYTPNDSYRRRLLTTTVALRN